MMTFGLATERSGYHRTLFGKLDAVQWIIFIASKGVLEGRVLMTLSLVKVPGRRFGRSRPGASS